MSACPCGDLDFSTTGGVCDVCNGTGKRPPIWIDCEGSHANGIAESRGEVMCPMCGGWFPGWDGTNELPGHSRQDILAMITRGDYG